MAALRHSIGTQLSLIIGVIFGLYLLVVSVIGYVIYRQYQGFSELASHQFERAMAAAELTRDAEVIAAEVFEIMVGGRRSLSAGNQRAENLAGLYRTARERLDQLDSSSLAGMTLHRDLDRWQTPFFERLARLSERLDQEDALKAAHLQRLDRLFLLLQGLPLTQSERLAPEQQRFVGQALAAMTYAAAAMSAERPGHLAQLEASATAVLTRLRQLPLAEPQWRELRRELEQLVPQTFASRTPLLQHARATLATARETRVLAQKLAGEIFNYHLQLKESAQQAIGQHQRLIRQSLLGLAIASLLLAAITVGAVVYIRRNIVHRINHLSSAMHAHLHGEAVPIPCAGRDEISGMGSSFAVFVEARHRAEQQLGAANRDLQQANRELERLSVTDELTRLANRRHFDQRLEQEWRRAQREGRTLAVVMADVDQFKRYNDAFGHQQGDDCLHRVAQAMAAQLKRSGDLIARYGGEEFILLLPELELEQAGQLAEALRRAVWDLALPHQTPSGRVTLSLGVATRVPTAGCRPEALIQAADQALYGAKSQGRNQVMLDHPVVLGAG